MQFLRRALAVFLIFSVSAGPSAAQDKTPLTLDDIHKLADITEPVFSPDGTYVYYTLSTHNLKADETVSDIWRVPFNGGPAERVTKTDKASESRPQLTRDGQRLYFLSDAGKDEETQVWSMKAKGGGLAKVTRIKGGVSDFALSPDGARLVVLAEVGKAVGAKGETKPPIVIDRFQFKQDYRGYLDDRRKHLFLVDVKTHDAVQLTTGDFDDYLPAWSPDGALISFVSMRRPGAERTFDYDVFVMKPEAGAEPRRLGAHEGDDSDPDWEDRPAWSPDSRHLVWLQAGDDENIYYSPFQMEVGDTGTGETRPVARIDRWFYHPRWSPDGKALYALIEEDRSTWLARIDPETDKVDYLTSGARFAYDFALGPNGEVAVLDGDPSHPYELRAVAPETRALTHHNDWLDQRKLGEMHEISAKSGDVAINGLYLTPPDYQPGKTYPMIVRVHGGPVYQFSNEFMFDWQLYAAAGYVVVGPNPRGSSGRGFDFARAIYADWGDLDVKDVHAVIDHLVDMGIADKGRLAVAGWSYGGILTDYLIASDNRFKAAVSGAGMANFFAGYGADQYVREYEYELGTPWKNAEVYRRVSYAFFNADKIKTPTLFECASADFNVPCIGAEQMYQALRSLDIPTRLVIYPGENHGLVTPSYIEDRLKRNLDWFSTYLKTE